MYYDLFGEGGQGYIARPKMVLNTHFWPKVPLETHRNIKTLAQSVATGVTGLISVTPGGSIPIRYHLWQIGHAPKARVRERVESLEPPKTPSIPREQRKRKRLGFSGKLADAS